jgi:hypothetical protein
VVGHEGVEAVFAGVAEGSVAQVVGQTDRLGQVFIAAQAAGQGAAELGDLDGVGQPGAVADSGSGCWRPREAALRKP